MFKAIIAMGNNREIGFEDGLPWPKEQGDLKFFKKTTWGQNLVLGRKTFDSLGATWLPNRNIYVLTHFNNYGWTKSDGYFKLGKSCTHIIQNITDLPEGDFWICGGKTIYELFMPKIQEFLVTHIKGSFAADTFMPEFEGQFRRQTLVEDNENFKIIKYER